MKTLIAFLIRISTWLLFALYAGLACAMLFTSSPYQHHVFLTSAGSAAAGVYRAAGTVTGYFALRDINEELQHRNAALEAEALELRRQLADARLRQYADTVTHTPALQRYSFIMAHVINNSTNRAANFITLDRGAEDGLQPEMGVVDHNGVVGIVNVVGPHSARVISLLNPDMRLSCKVVRSDYVGSLVWDGEDPGEAVLEELPRHARFRRGDTIVTTGYSTAFPAEVPVGIVWDDDHSGRSTDFLAIRVKLFTDFTTLSTVRVVSDTLAAELRRVEAPMK